VDRVLGHDGLARSSRRADEDRLALVENLQGVELEAVERIGMIRENRSREVTRAAAPSCPRSRAACHLPSILPMRMDAS